MINLLENLMMELFIIAMLIWLLQIWKTNKAFSRFEKIRTVTFAAAFMLGFFSMMMEDNKIGAVICLIGIVISEFTAAVVFYENYKDVEIPYE